MVLLAKCLLLLFMIIVVHGDIVVDVEQNVHLDNCCNGCCPCNSCEYKCKKDVDGICRKECRRGETNSMVGCDAKNGDDCDLKCCIETEKGCWNPITLMWVENGTIAELGGCTCEICINGVWVPDPEKILKHCHKCRVFGEPHIQAFTKAMCAWHVPCNHALAQDGFSTAPRFGVFNKFEEVIGIGGVRWNVARIGKTTYKEGSTEVKLVPGSSAVEVTVPGGTFINTISNTKPKHLNAGLVKTNIFAWETADFCIKIYGNHHMMIKLCSFQITIWAPKWMHRGYPLLGGLCSSNNDQDEDELVARNGSKYSSPGINHLCNGNFGLNWQAYNGVYPGCPASNFVDQKICINDKTYDIECQNKVARSGLNNPDATMFHKACMFDLCIAFTFGGPDEEGAMSMAYDRMIREAEMEQDNTIDCCQDTKCTTYAKGWNCKHGHPNHLCISTLCSGKDCSCCP